MTATCPLGSPSFARRAALLPVFHAYLLFPPARSVRHIPRGIVKAKAARFTEEQKVRRKLANVRAHTREDSREGIPEPERKKAIVGERR